MALTNESLVQRRQANVPRGVSTACPIFVDRASNAELWDVEGRRYIDFAGGIGVLNVGHAHPEVQKAIQEQSQRCLHSAFQVVAYPGYIDLAEKLNGRVPVERPAKTILFSTGAEALENAVKIAKAATGRTGLISFLGGFHGRTALTLALTGKTLPYKKGFGPFPSGIFHAPYPIARHGVSEDDSINAIERIFKASIHPSEVAAIVIEPVQGEGGFYIAPPSFLRRLRGLCDEHKILLIADEVQSGYARTGKLFAIEHSGVKPDIITIAKSIAAGLPLSAVSGRASIMDSIDPGGLGGTYAGNPLACAAALAVLEVIDRERLLERSAKIGASIKDRLGRFAAEHPTIGEVRALGAMVAFEFVRDKSSQEPDADKAKKFAAKALEKGLILLSCGIFANVIRILVPLTVPESQLEEGLNIMEQTLKELS